MPTLDREQTRIVREIKREARRRGYEGADRRRFVNAAIQTGLVESNLHNLAGGDADSEGWRQERTSIYGTGRNGPRNVRASVGRFANEFEQFADPGERSFEIAAQVQRPAAQYRGRYHDVRREANAIRRGVTLNGRMPSPAEASRNGGGVPSGFDPGSPAAQELVAGAQRVVPSGGLSTDAWWAASPVMPDGAGGLSSSGGPAPRGSLASALSGTPAGGQAVDFSPSRARAARREARDQLGLGGLRNAEGLADEISSFAKDHLGLTPGSRDRSRAENAAAGGAATSDHLEDVGVGKGKEAVDLPTTPAGGGWGQYRKVVRKLGLKPAASGFTQGTIKVGGRRFRVQVIFGELNDHGDHIHVGFERVG